LGGTAVKRGRAPYALLGAGTPSNLNYKKKYLIGKDQ
jgi:hypothetical protein